MARKKKGAPPADDAAGAPAWVMTFADLMSLLMCFFVLLLSFSELDAAKYKQVAGSMKHAFGVQREIKTLESPRGVSIIAKEFSPGKPRPTLERVLKQKTTDDNRAYLELLSRGELEKLINEGRTGGPASGTGKGDTDKDKAGKGMESEPQTGEGKDKGKGPSPEADEGSPGMLAERTEGGSPGDATGRGAGGDGTEGAEGGDGPPGISQKQAARIQATMLNIALEEEIDEGLLEVETMDDGVLVRVREQGSFPSGTADMAQAFVPVLQKIAGAVISNQSRLVVSGHTDNRPIATARYPSNWMLSAARATSVVQALSSRGYIAQERMEVRAHADTTPVAENETAVGRARNRRIEIFIGAPPTAADSNPRAAVEASPPSANRAAQEDTT